MRAGRDGVGRNHHPASSGARARWRGRLHAQVTELLREGLIEFVGQDDAGEPVFRVTPAGELEAAKALDDWNERRGG